MKKKNKNSLVLVGVGALALLAMSSKGQGDGSESGGIQIPFLSPQTAGADPSGGSPVYNITFPEFPGFPTGDTGSAAGTTKKETLTSADHVQTYYTSGLFSPIRELSPVSERPFAAQTIIPYIPDYWKGYTENKFQDTGVKKQAVATSKTSNFVLPFIGDTGQPNLGAYLKNTNIYGQPVTKKSSVGSQKLAPALINTGLVKSGSSSSAPMAAPTKKSGTIITGGSKTPFTRVVRR